MSNAPSVERDERTVAVENASYRWAYGFLAYALLVDVAYRAVVHHEAAWDLMAFVFAGGILCTVYQARLKTLAHSWAKRVVVISCVAAVIAAIIAAIMVGSGN